jgi:hypothetical protein
LFPNFILFGVKAQCWCFLEIFTHNCFVPKKPCGNTSNLGPKIPFVGVYVFRAMKFSCIIDVLGLDIPSSFVSFPNLKKDWFFVAFFSFEKGHFVATFFDSSMPSTPVIAFSSPRTLFSTFVVIVFGLNLPVVDSNSNVVQEFIFC